MKDTAKFQQAKPTLRNAASVAASLTEKTKLMDETNWLRKLLVE